MEQTILNHFQQTVLALFKKTPLAKKYYLSGGTALAEFYLHHRKSEDLDFFSKSELNEDHLDDFFSKISPLIRCKKVDKIKHYQMIVNYDERVRNRTTQPKGLPKGVGYIFGGLTKWEELPPS